MNDRSTNDVPDPHFEQPCPWCGKHDLVYEKFIDGTSAVLCCDCDIRGPRRFNHEDAKLAWNDRQ